MPKMLKRSILRNMMSVAMISGIWTLCAMLRNTVSRLDNSVSLTKQAWILCHPSHLGKKPKIHEAVLQDRVPGLHVVLIRWHSDKTIRDARGANIDSGVRHSVSFLELDRDCLGRILVLIRTRSRRLRYLELFPSMATLQASTLVGLEDQAQWLVGAQNWWHSRHHLSALDFSSNQACANILRSSHWLCGEMSPRGHYGEGGCFAIPSSHRTGGILLKSKIRQQEGWGCVLWLL